MGDDVGVLFTDDEIVAAAIQRGVAWPHPLPTVELDSDSLLSAGSRGARSLLVRDLASTNDSSLVLDESVSSLIDEVGKSTERAIAYVADLSSPALLAGSSTYLYRQAGSENFSVLDLVSSSGVHDLRELGPDEGLAAFFAVVENTFTFGIRHGASTGEPVLFVSSNVGPTVLAVAQGTVLIGEFVEANGSSAFQQNESVDQWDPPSLVHAMGLDTRVERV